MGQGRRAEKKGIRPTHGSWEPACVLPGRGAIRQRLEGEGSRASGPLQGRTLGASWPGVGVGSKRLAQQGGCVGTAPSADLPAESPSSAQLGCQIWKPGRPQACLGPVAGSNLLGPEGKAPISSAGLRNTRRAETPGWG